MPLAHPPGDAQADFGEALVVIAGVECKATWSSSRTATTGLCRRFRPRRRRRSATGTTPRSDFGGVPRRIVYASWRWRGFCQRRRSSANSNRTIYSQIASGGREGNDKGKVEGWSGTSGNFFVPIPRCGRVLSAQVRRTCRGGTRPFEALLPYRRSRLRHADDAGHVVVAGALPPQDYSVPTAYGHPGERLRGRASARSRHRAGSVDLRAAELGLVGAQDGGARSSGAAGRRWQCRTSFSGCGACWRRGWASRDARVRAGVAAARLSLPCLDTVASTTGRDLQHTEAA